MKKIAKSLGYALLLATIGMLPLPIIGSILGATTTQEKAIQFVGLLTTAFFLDYFFWSNKSENE